MGITRAIQKENSEAFVEFAQASVEYKRACSKYARLKLVLNFLDSSDEELGQFYKVQKEYKEQCKKYYKARTKYASSLKKAIAKVANPTNEELSEIALQINS